MNAPRPILSLRSVSRIAIIVPFFLLLWLPTLDLFFKLDRTTQVNEKRKLVPFPSWKAGISDVHGFISGCEQYFNDHFGFRKKLINWGYRWKRTWFDESPDWRVWIGRSGWLYLAESDRLVDTLKTGTHDDAWLKAWKGLLQSRHDWLAAHGIRYIFVVPPNKNSAYPEYLPDGLQLSTKSTLDSFFDYMRTNSTVEIVDLRPVLSEAKKGGQTYYFTDTHWNDYGAFIGYQELIRKLSKTMPRLEPLPLSAFAMKINISSGGNLAQMLADEEAMLEKCALTMTPRPPLKLLLQSTNPPTGNIVTILNPVATGKAVIYHDSFAFPWTQFLGQHFNQLSFYYQQHHLDCAYLEKEMPDLVIDEMVEDVFLEADPAELKRLDHLQ